jgi:lipopolysaccharide/colanic/teichoic acid biosynthesis glycosyltransferase
MMTPRMRWRALCACEGVVCAGGCLAGAHLISGGLAAGAPFWLTALGGAGLFLLALSACGLHHLRAALDDAGHGRRLLGALVLAAGGAAIVVPLCPPEVRRFAIGALGGAAAACILLRICMPWLAELLGLPLRVFLVGEGRPARHAAREIGRAAPAEVVGFARLSTPTLLERALSAEAHSIVVAQDDHRGGAMAELLACRTAGLEVRLLPDFLETHCGKIAVDYARPSDLVFGGGFHRTPVADFVRSLISFGFAAAALTVLAPLSIAAVVVSRLLGAGPLLARELRVGERGGVFALCVPAPSPAGRLLVRVGGSRLPSLWNLLSGELWLVGPRALAPTEYERLVRRRPFAELREAVRPGWIGWADLAPGSDGEPLHDFDYDLHYVRRRSLWFDARVVWRAAGTALSGSGSP